MSKQKFSWGKAGEFKHLLEKCGEKLSKSTLDALVGLAVKDAAYAYKDACMLMETELKRKTPAGKARVSILYVLSAICKKSKKQYGTKDKYCDRLTPRLETLASLLAEMPSQHWEAVGKVALSWKKEHLFSDAALAHFQAFTIGMESQLTVPTFALETVQLASDSVPAQTAASQEAANLSFSPASEFGSPVAVDLPPAPPVSKPSSTASWGKGIQARAQQAGITSPVLIPSASPAATGSQQTQTRQAKDIIPAALGDALQIAEQQSRPTRLKQPSADQPLGTASRDAGPTANPQQGSKQDMPGMRSPVLEDGTKREARNQSGAAVDASKKHDVPESRDRAGSKYRDWRRDKDRDRDRDRHHGHDSRRTQPANRESDRSDRSNKKRSPSPRRRERSQSPRRRDRSRSPRRSERSRHLDSRRQRSTSRSREHTRRRQRSRSRDRYEDRPSGQPKEPPTINNGPLDAALPPPPTRDNAFGKSPAESEKLSSVDPKQSSSRWEGSATAGAHLGNRFHQVPTPSTAQSSGQQSARTPVPSSDNVIDGGSSLNGTGRRKRPRFSETAVSVGSGQPPNQPVEGMALPPLPSGHPPLPSESKQADLRPPQPPPGGLPRPPDSVVPPQPEVAPPQPPAWPPTSERPGTQWQASQQWQAVPPPQPPGPPLPSGPPPSMPPPPPQPPTTSPIRTAQELADSFVVAAMAKLDDEAQTADVPPPPRRSRWQGATISESNSNAANGPQAAVAEAIAMAKRAAAQQHGPNQPSDAPPPPPPSGGPEGQSSRRDPIAEAIAMAKLAAAQQQHGASQYS